MADQARVRNTSDSGDLEVPSLGIVIPFRHEAVVDADVAASLIESGHFVAVNRPSDTPAPTPPDPDPAPSPQPAGSGQDAAPADTSTPTDASTTDSEEQHQ